MIKLILALFSYLQEGRAIMWNVIAIFNGIFFFWFGNRVKKLNWVRIFVLQVKELKQILKKLKIHVQTTLACSLMNFRKLEESEPA